jgi:hypothetical protein
MFTDTAPDCSASAFAAKRSRLGDREPEAEDGNRLNGAFT